MKHACSTNYSNKSYATLKIYQLYYFIILNFINLFLPIQSIHY